MDDERTLAQVVDWARGREDVRTIVLAGSAATGYAHALANLDIKLHVRDVGAVAVYDRWWNALSDLLAVERLEDDRPFRGPVPVRDEVHLVL